MKSSAGAAIRGGKHWMTFLVSAVIMIASSLIKWITSYGEVNDKWISGLGNGVSGVAPGVFMGYNLGFLLLNIFILFPLIVGICGFFVYDRLDAGQFSDMFLGFRNGYSSVVLTSFTTNLFIGLWTLLLVIPGIYKTLQYIMIPFLLLDNPWLSSQRVRQISHLMTDEEEDVILVLSLSFIGWFLIPITVSIVLEMTSAPISLTGIVVTLGLALTIPYYYAMLAKLYIFLRDRAIQTDMAQPEELDL